MSSCGHDGWQEGCEECEREHMAALVAAGMETGCPGMGIDDLCTWPDVESCGLCTLGMNPDLLP